MTTKETTEFFTELSQLTDSMRSDLDESLLILNHLSIANFKSNQVLYDKTVNHLKRISFTLSQLSLTLSYDSRKRC